MANKVTRSYEPYELERAVQEMNHLLDDFQVSDLIDLIVHCLDLRGQADFDARGPEAVGEHAPDFIAANAALAAFIDTRARIENEAARSMAGMV